MAESQLDPSSQKKIALDLLLEAWDKGIEVGLDRDLMGEVMIYMGITDLVADLGQDCTADAFEDLPDRIRQGEFTLPGELVERHSYDMPNPMHA